MLLPTQRAAASKPRFADALVMESDGPDYSSIRVPQVI
jgi:hypothetical protein